jgi:AbrB family looped-hinge helix DNA binding protein
MELMTNPDRPDNGFSEEAVAFGFDAVRPVEKATVYVRARIGDGGRLVIPSEIRKMMNLSTGDDVVMAVRNNVLEVVPQLQAVRQVQARLMPLKRGGVDQVDAFLAERRDESRMDDEGNSATSGRKAENRKQ